MWYKADGGVRLAKPQEMRVSFPSELRALFVFFVRHDFVLFSTSLESSLVCHDHVYMNQVIVLIHDWV